MHAGEKTTKGRGEDWAKPGRMGRMNKDMMEHFQDVVRLGLDFTCMSDDKPDTTTVG